MLRWMRGISSGLISSAVIIFFLTFVLATILRLSPLTERDLGVIPTLLSAGALIIGGVFAGWKAQTRGWLVGGLTGLILSFIILFFRLFTAHQFPMLHQLVFYLMAVGLMSLGGMFGVNLSPRK